MTQAQKKMYDPALQHHLPQVKGSYETGAALGQMSWFRAGGRADLLFRPADEKDLAAFLAQWPETLPCTVIGAGSNILVRDGGVRGVVIILGEAFAKVQTGETFIRVGAAMPLRRLARLAAEAGRGGFAFMRGIPGTLGGGVYMNAGAYGSDMAALVQSVRVMHRRGRIQIFNAAELAFAYRQSSLPIDAIVLDAELRAEKASPEEITASMEAAAEARREAQPAGARTGGSTFKNPSNAKAWELIEAAGCRLWREGGASVSARHANFLVNEGKASAKQIEVLGERIAAQVKAKTGIELAWEIRRIGEEA